MTGQSCSDMAKLQGRRGEALAVQSAASCAIGGVISGFPFFSVERHINVTTQHPLLLARRRWHRPRRHVDRQRSRWLLLQTWDLAVWIGAAGLSFSPHWSAAAAPPPQGVNGPG